MDQNLQTEQHQTCEGIKQYAHKAVSFGTQEPYPSCLAMLILEIFKKSLKKQK